MNALRNILERLAARQEIALIGLLVLTTAMMTLPLPTMLADVLIASNIGLSVLVMMVAIHLSAPVEFSTLPALILLMTAFRLSLTITTSRMILIQADAGEIIRTFGEFVIAGNVLVGLVVYLIITIVQFVVISKGSERVAEVAARFTLDALPGKQISIDTDLKNGDIDQTEARRRRALLERESQLYGAMDGAMKFVKGDSIASLVVIVINLVGGIAIGCVQRGLSFGDAVQTYSLLAVGDGLIAQIPALLISLTAGVTVTRTASESGGNLGQDIAAQLTAEPRTLQISAFVLAALAFVPGFPAPVFFTLAIILGGLSWLLVDRAAREHARHFAARRKAELAAPEPARLIVSLGRDLAREADAIDRALQVLRSSLGSRLGITIPQLRIADETLALADGWRLDVNGVPTNEGRSVGVGDLIEALQAAVARIAGQFVGIQETQILLKTMEPTYKDLLHESMKAAPVGRVAEVLRRLLNEEISVADLRTILESVAEWAPREQNTAVLAEHVRTALRSQISFALAGPSKILPLAIIEPSLDQALRGLIHATPLGTNLFLDAAATGQLVSVLKRLEGSLPGAHLAILASADLRRHLHALLNRQGLSLPVIAHSEIAADFRAEIVATLRYAEIFPTTPQSEQPHLVAVGGRS